MQWNSYHTKIYEAVAISHWVLYIQKYVGLITIEAFGLIVVKFQNIFRTLI